MPSVDAQLVRRVVPSARIGEVGAAAAAIAVSVTVGVAGAGYRLGWGLVAAGIVFATALVVAIQDWRRVAVGLLVYLPYSGVVGLVLFPRTYLGEVVRDVLLVTPLYLGILWRRRDVQLPTAMTTPLILLGLLAVLQLANPSLPSIGVGLVGIRGWIFFIPLAVVGANLVSDRNAAARIMCLALASGIPVLVLGIVEALLLAAGKGALLWGVYGASASAVFAAPGAAGAAVSLGALHRVSALFTYPEAYYCFATAMFVPGYFLWRQGPTRSLRRIGGVGFGLAIVAALTSGIRFAYIGVPILLVVTFLLDGGRPSITMLPFAAVAGTAAVILFHVPVLGLPRDLWGVVRVEAPYLLGNGVRAAARATWLGLGPGTDTGAARRVAGDALFSGVGRWQESYLVKTWLELGLPGVALLVWSLVAVARAVASRVAAFSARPLLAVCGGLVIETIAILPKGSVLDQAPAAVYFWLIVGIALGARTWDANLERIGSRA